MKTGENLYSAFKKNTQTVWIVMLFSLVCVVGSLFFAYFVYAEAQRNIYTINGQGELVPLSVLPEQEADLIQAKANVAYFVDNYLSLNANSMKSKQEKILWLIGKQPTAVINDRIKKGYFSEFLTIAGLQQNAYILENTFKISNSAPYIAKCVVRVERANGNSITYYDDYLELKMEKVNRNYPYNPYGLLITQFSEEIKKIVEPTKEEKQATIEASEQAINQIPQPTE